VTLHFVNQSPLISTEATTGVHIKVAMSKSKFRD